MCLVFLCQNRAVAAEGRRKGDALLRAALIPAELYAACNEASRTVSSMIRLPRLKRRKRLVVGGRFAGPCGRAARAGRAAVEGAAVGARPRFRLGRVCVGRAPEPVRGRSESFGTELQVAASGGRFGADKEISPSRLPNLSESAPCAPPLPPPPQARHARGNGPQRPRRPPART